MVRTRPGVRTLSTPLGTPTLLLVDGHTLTEGATVDGRGAGLRLAARALSAELEEPYVSRSYCGSWALVGAHTSPLGVDIEAVTPWTSDQVRSMLTAQEAERAMLDDAGATSVWSGKEALAKALGDAVAYDPRRLASPYWWSDGSAGRWRCLGLDLPAPHVGWVCWAHA